MLFNYIFWNVQPEIFTIGPLSPRWYGLLFASGFLVGLFMVRKMFEAEKAPEAWLDTAFIYVVVGAVLGARLGHVFFYDWDYYSKHLAEIPKIWEGGLASHGGAIGIIIALWLYSRFVTHRSMLWILDKVVVPTALAGAFIRLGNLMNSEIVGKPTDSNWGFKFVRSTEDRNTWTACEGCEGPDCLETGHSLYRRTASGIEEMAACVPDLSAIPVRHPVQLYEAIGYVLIFLVLFFTYWKTDRRFKPGFLFGLFLALVFGARFVLEYFKVSQGGFESEFGNVLSTGQLLSIPFVLIGLYFIFRPAKLVEPQPIDPEVDKRNRSRRKGSKVKP